MIIDGAPPARVDELPAVLGTSGRLVNETVGRLAALGWLLETEAERRLVPHRDPERLAPAELLAALRGGGPETILDCEDDVTRRLLALHEQEMEVARRVWGAATLAEMATAADERSEHRPGRRRGAR